MSRHNVVTAGAPVKAAASYRTLKTANGTVKVNVKKAKAAMRSAIATQAVSIKAPRS